MSLSQDRIDFTLAISILVQWAAREELYLAYDDVKAKDGHKVGSFHYKGLAADLNLYLKNEDGGNVYQVTTEAHRKIGEQWKKMGGTWGGDFSSPDGNHYSWGE